MIETTLDRLRIRREVLTGVDRKLVDEAIGALELKVAREKRGLERVIVIELAPDETRAEAVSRFFSMGLLTWQKNKINNR